MIKLSATIPLQYDTVFSPFAASEFEDGLAWLKKSGFDGIEICIAQPSLVDGTALHKKLRQHDLAVSTISTGQALGLEGISLVSNTTEIRNRCIARIKEHIALAAQIESPLVTIGLLRGVGSLENKKQELEFLTDGILKCAECAKKNGVKLVVEPINQSETYLLNSVQDTLDFLANLPNVDNVGILLDTYHSNKEDSCITDAMNRVGTRLLHVHIADSNRGLPGTGNIDFNKVVQTLNHLPYSGFVSLETLSLPDKGTVKQESYSRLARYFK